MQDSSDGQRQHIRLRFLAEAAIDLLSGRTDEASASRAAIPADASEDMLRTLLDFAVPMLRATTRRQVADQIEAALAEPAPNPSGQA